MRGEEVQADDGPVDGVAGVEGRGDGVVEVAPECAR